MSAARIGRPGKARRRRTRAEARAGSRRSAVGARAPGVAGSDRRRWRTRTAAAAAEERGGAQASRAQAGIDVARAAAARRLRQRRADGGGVAPGVEGEAPAFAGDEVELVGAEGGEARDAGGGGFRRGGQVLEGDPGHRAGEAGQHLGLEALDVDLDEARQAVGGDERVEGGDLDRLLGVPAHAGEARRRAPCARRSRGRARRRWGAGARRRGRRGPARGPAASGRRVTAGGQVAARGRRRRARCGSRATTRAPARRSARVRLPAWAPMSKARSPGATMPR